MSGNQEEKERRKEGKVELCVCVSGLGDEMKVEK